MKGLFAFTVTLATVWSSGSRADMPATHGMLLFGNQKTYASHLPMFHSPHDYQLVMEVELLPAAGSPGLQKYNDLKAGSAEIFTLVPAPMDLTKVIDGAITEFSADVFQGHFEKGGKDLGAVKVKVVKQIVSSKLDAQAKDPEKYIVFGASGEYFAAHIIEGKPNFDAILTVTAPYTLADKVCKGRACPPPVELPVKDAQLPLTLNGGHEVPVVDFGLGSFGGTLSDVLKVNYLEQDELAH